MQIQITGLIALPNTRNPKKEEAVKHAAAYLRPVKNEMVTLKVTPPQQKKHQK